MMQITRVCKRLFSKPRVVNIAAAVQPNPIKIENAALPVNPTRRNSPSVINANADKYPLSSIRNSARYKIAICGKKDNSIPTPENSARKNSAATSAPRASTAA